MFQHRGLAWRVGAALEASGDPLVITSGTPALPNGRVATEHDVSPASSVAAGREANARAALDMSAHGVRSSVVRLPRSVHGEGDRHGFIVRLIGMAREAGVSGYVGDGSSRWPAVHVLDAAHLYRLAVEGRRRDRCCTGSPTRACRHGTSRK